MNQNPPRLRQKYDETFKREALNHWRASGKSAAAIGAELGVSSHLLFSWRRRLEYEQEGRTGASAPKPATLAEAEAQLAAARREIGRLREQRDILKKTLGIFSEPPPNVSNGSTK